VHRSYWVRSSAIRAVRREGGKYSVELSSGLLVPISEANRGLIRELARTRGIPVHPPL
jgi:DNA-binding LytR/AlgR family response regulator